MPVLRELIREQGAATFVVAAAVGANMVLGGCGVAFPLVELALEVLLAGLAVLWVWLLPAQRLGEISPRIWVVAVMVAALPLLQLVPLPPAVWGGAARAGMEHGNLALVGLEQSGDRCR